MKRPDCYVRYWLKVTAEIPMGFDHEYKLMFPVGSVLDLNERNFLRRVSALTVQYCHEDLRPSEQTHFKLIEKQTGKLV